ncbi:hypothetical protein NA57DRAFT_56378 [Rhizodiscina lignyota]|uniref:Extracellular membrane protein CFEM domain-containing protein n=1 Tax=Rhizodiscina lignyota TaxID=1504668 RepID=A0A9P4IIC7_9PEZI|nr:hypothetical protein NA57DRAFT_56378 [Rhizodiscina lignyota]
MEFRWLYILLVLCCILQCLHAAAPAPEVVQPKPNTPETGTEPGPATPETGTEPGPDTPNPAPIPKVPTPNTPTIPKAPTPNTGEEPNPVDSPTALIDAGPLGEYDNNNKQAPFSDFFDGDDDWEPFHQKVFEIIQLEEQSPDNGNGNGNDNTEGNNGQKSNGNTQRPVTPITFGVVTAIVDDSAAANPETIATSTITSVFHPSRPTEACNVWSSLRSYCGNGGTDCACFSSTYYVPDQWNSVAAACAQFQCTGSSGKFCGLASEASSSSSYCSITDRKSIAFAAVTPTTSDSTAKSTAHPAATTSDSVTQSSTIRSAVTPSSAAQTSQGSSSDDSSFAHQVVDVARVGPLVTVSFFVAVLACIW